jgi:hypothetical protein
MIEVLGPLVQVEALLTVLGERLDPESGLVLHALYKLIGPDEPYEAGPDFGQINMFGPNPQDRYPGDDEIEILEFPLALQPIESDGS